MPADVDALGGGGEKKVKGVLAGRTLLLADALVVGVVVVGAFGVVSKWNGDGMIGVGGAVFRLVCPAGASVVGAVFVAFASVGGAFHCDVGSSVMPDGGRTNGVGTGPAPRETLVGVVTTGPGGSASVEEETGWWMGL